MALSREHSAESSDADYPREPFRDHLDLDFSPPQSPEPAAPASRDPPDVEMTEATVDTTTVGPSATATPDLSTQGMGESLPAVTNKRDFWKAFEEIFRPAVESVEASKSSKIPEAQWSTSIFYSVCNGVIERTPP